jgi:hypothetical protein
MRTFNLTSGGTITTPDELCFAFNPCFLQIEGVTHTLDLTIDFYVEGVKDSSATLALYGGKASLEASAYLRAGFTGKAVGTEIFSTTQRAEARVDGVTIPFCVIYGSMFVGDIFNPSRTIRLWSNYPQVISFYHPHVNSGEAEVYIQRDKEEPHVLDLPSGEEKAGITNYDNKASLFPMVHSGQLVVFSDKETTKTTFSMQFDGTFTGIEGNIIINVDVDNAPQCDDHIFLRWLDKWGMWQYWLFKIGEVGVSDVVVGGALVFLTGTTYPYYTTRNISKSIVKQVAVCAPSVNRERWDFLSTIKGSVNVCAYDTTSQSWMPVDVAVENAVWREGANAPVLQDFAVKVIFPTIQHQKL